MRFGKADQVMQLAQEMQASRMGLSLSDIESRFRVSRRTAQRMRDAVIRLYPQVEETIDDERRPRWRLPGSRVSVGDLTADELADLEAVARLLRRENLRARAKSLDGIITKLKALMKPALATRIGPDLEVLLEAEGLAMRPGPRPQISDDNVRTIRMAILQGRALYMSYKRRSDGRASGREVWPLGFLFGNRHYLVAVDPAKDKAHPRLFALGNIVKVSIAAGLAQRPEGFSLKAFAERSFGVFQEEPEDIAWRFLPAAAASAEDYNFHPTQTKELQKDGSLIVRFHAGGLLEMCWHLMTWGRDVEVLAPKRLQEMLKQAHRHSGFRTEV